MERTLHTLVKSTVHTNKLLQKLLDTPTLTQTLDDNKKGENVSTLLEPQVNKESSETDVPSSSTLNTSELRKRKIGTQSQRDKEKKRAKG